MDRKSKTWLIALIVLLIMAMIGVIIFGNQLADSRKENLALYEELNEVQEKSDAINAELVKAQEQSDALQGDLEAANAEVTALSDSLKQKEMEIDALKAEELSMSVEKDASEEVSSKEVAAQSAQADAAAEVIAAQDADSAEEISAQSAQADAADPEAVQAFAAETESSADLQEPSEAALKAEAALQEKAQELEAANAAIDELQAQIEEITQRDSDAYHELQAQLEAAQERALQLEREYELACAEYEARLAELEAYRLSRDLSEGEAHLATTASLEIEVASDGVTAAIHYVNNSISGNAVSLTLICDGVELYASELIAPGESLEEIALNEPLSAGVHEVQIVTTVYHEDGSVQLSSRVPAALIVAE